MNVTKDIINDLIPLYAANECSADTRALVEEYLRQHPDEAAALRRVNDLTIPRTTAAPSAGLDELGSLRKARRLIRRRSWVLGFAIFFSLVPFSVLHTGGHTYWLFLESPKSVLIYGALALASWFAYFNLRNSSQGL